VTGDAFAESPMVPTPQNSGTKVTLLGTFFTDTNTGWAVGAGGTMVRTQDGGATWTAVPRRTPALLMSIFFSDENHGWVVGQNGTVLHSYDGGNQWRPQMSGTTSALYGAFFKDPKYGWIVGARGTILHTQDGGQSWIDQASGTSADLFGVQFLEDRPAGGVEQDDAAARVAGVDGGDGVVFFDDGTGYCLTRVTDSNYAMAYDEDTADYIVDPLSNNGGLYIVNFQEDNRFGDVSIEASVDGGGSELIFDPLGGTVRSGGLPGLGGTITVTSGEFSYQISVAPFTGKLTVAEL